MSAMHLDHLMAQRRLPAKAAQRGLGSNRCYLTFAKPRRHFAYARRQDGFAIVTAIFLLLLLAALGALMVTMSSVQHTTSAQDVQGSRAYQAARSGIEWGVYQVMAPENANPFVPGNRATCSAIPVAAAVGNVTLGGALAGYVVNVRCTGGADIPEGDNTIRVFTLTSTATMGAVGSMGYVEREISATVSTCRKTADGSAC